MNNRPHNYLKEQRPAPLSRDESEQLWRAVASNIGADQTIPEQELIVTPLFFTLQARPAFAFVTGLMFILTSAITAQAADKAVPGDLLYPLDIGLEQARLAITPEEDQAQLRFRYTLERVAELETIAAIDPDSPQLEMNLEQVEEHIEKTLPNLSQLQRNSIRQAMQQTVERSEPLRARRGAMVQTTIPEVMTDMEANTAQDETEISKTQPVSPVASPSGYTNAPAKQQTQDQISQPNESGVREANQNGNSGDDRSTPSHNNEPDTGNGPQTGPGNEGATDTDDTPNPTQRRTGQSEQDTSMTNDDEESVAETEEEKEINNTDQGASLPQSKQKGR